MPLQIAVVPCAKCNTAIEIKVAPPRVTQSVYSTTIVIDHPIAAMCPVCGVEVTAQLAALPPMGLVCIPVPASEQERIIIPQGNLPLIKH